MHVYCFASTDVGRKRDQNQDAYLVAHDLQLFAVADGMGGHRGGEVASDLAVRTLDAHVRSALARATAPSATTASRVLVDAVCAANTAIRDFAAAHDELSGMGTTTTGFLVAGDRAVLAHVGDSRAYLVRRARIRQLSEDHSFVWQQLKAGLISPAQAKSCPYKNVILRALGVEANVAVDVIDLGLEPGDTFILCSDGLCGVVDDHEIEAMVNERSLHCVPELLIDLANDRGGPDNITVVAAYASLV